ncbi:MAG TPA: MarR family transcriptional regulator [Mycobacteriales bacterium]|nr:MarR family transcriptional regulator [Mycobacteriales bacterium]
MPTTASRDEQSDEGIDEVADAVLAGSRALVAVSARSIASAKGVTFPQYRMLVVLESGPSNLTELARHLDVAPSTALRMVDRLQAADLVTREVRPDNRRETVLSLTAAGRRTVRTVNARRRRDLRAIVAKIPAGQRADLARAMAVFAAVAEEVWPIAASE